MTGPTTREPVDGNRLASVGVPDGVIDIATPGVGATARANASRGARQDGFAERSGEEPGFSRGLEIERPRCASHTPHRSSDRVNKCGGRCDAEPVSGLTPEPSDPPIQLHSALPLRRLGVCFPSSVGVTIVAIEIAITGVVATGLVVADVVTLDLVADDIGGAVSVQSLGFGQQRVQVDHHQCLSVRETELACFWCRRRQPEGDHHRVVSPHRRRSGEAVCVYRAVGAPLGRTYLIALDLEQPILDRLKHGASLRPGQIRRLDFDEGGVIHTFGGPHAPLVHCPLLNLGRIHRIVHLGPHVAELGELRPLLLSSPLHEQDLVAHGCPGVFPLASQFRNGVDVGGRNVAVEPSLPDARELIEHASPTQLLGTVRVTVSRGVGQPGGIRSVAQDLTHTSSSSLFKRGRLGRLKQGAEAIEFNGPFSQFVIGQPHHVLRGKFAHHLRQLCETPACRHLNILRTVVRMSTLFMHIESLFAELNEFSVSYMANEGNGSNVLGEQPAAPQVTRTGASQQADLGIA